MCKQKTILNKNESGSIMLEVVAVLALMGVMGAMLFRQIYQRNQELHNIQMASEIRTVKEAFSAYIQSNRASILDACSLPSSNEVAQCTISEGIPAKIKDYLPDGWFADGGDPKGTALGNAYTFTLWNYQDSNARRVVYGVVVPRTDTLPETGWNFRRAARVALLIGADGGAYDYNITQNDIAGSLGSWSLDPNDIITGNNCANGQAPGSGDDKSCPIYVAMTGIDIFAPEYDAGEGSINLPSSWSLGLKDLHAYNYFAVGHGGANESDCFTIYHHQFEETTGSGLKEGDVKSDDIKRNITNCKPLFWVESDDGANGTSGNVYVQNDLNVGADMTGAGDHALKLTAEGVIKQKDGLTIDKDGRIIANNDIGATAIGDVAANEKYVLDPAYTSTMNDIRLTSRGGARLSDILPNYILKEQKEISTCNGTQGGATGTNCKINKPTCPTGYTPSLAIIPTIWNKVDLTVNVPQDAQNDVQVEGEKGICVKVDNSEKATGDHNGSNWYITLGLKENSNCAYDSSAKAIAQTYCVAPDLSGAPDKERSTNACEGAGFEWIGVTATVPAHCQYKYNLTNINAISDSGKKAAACKAAGWTWDPTANSGSGNCSCPSGTSPYCS